LIIKNAALLLLTLAGTMLAGDITIGSVDGVNCYPYLCFASDGGTEFQQQFRAGAFSGAIDIDRFSLFHDLSADSGPALMDPATFTIGFSTSATAFGAASSDFASNIGADSQVFGTYHLQGLMPDTLTLLGTTFHYDPSMGDLLLDIKVTSDGSSGCAYCTFFQADYTGQDTLRSFINSDTNATNTLGGPVTNFNGVFQNAVPLSSGDTLGAGTPEPAPVALMLSGLAAIGGMVRRRRRAA
jgi:hypothetical protein